MRKHTVNNINLHYPFIQIVEMQLHGLKTKKQGHAMNLMKKIRNFLK